MADTRMQKAIDMIREAVLFVEAVQELEARGWMWHILYNPLRELPYHCTIFVPQDDGRKLKYEYEAYNLNVAFRLAFKMAAEKENS